MQPSDIKVLIVDDEEKIVTVIKSYLKNCGYATYEAYNGEQALQLFERVNPALVVLDLMLPDVPGEEVCKRLRKKSRVPIIMLTAKIEEEDVLKGLDIGADDYMTKPFSPRQLVARIGALIRRSGDDLAPLCNVMSFYNDDLTVNCQKHEVCKNGEVVNLTPNEYKILMSLIKYPQKVFTREELITVALGEDFYGFDRTIDSHIKNLRQKIENDPKATRYILTVHGIGYRFGGD